MRSSGRAAARPSPAQRSKQGAGPSEERAAQRSDPTEAEGEAGEAQRKSNLYCNKNSSLLIMMKSPYSKIHILSLAGLAFFLACGLSDSSNTEPSEKEGTEQGQQRDMFLEVYVANAKIRESPDLEATIVDVLKKGEILRYLDDSTSFKTLISLNGEKLNKPWYKVKRKGVDEEEAWIHGAIVRFLNEHENKQIALMESRQKLSGKEQGLRTVQRKEEEDVERIRGYSQQLNGLNYREIESIQKALDAFQSEIVQTNSVTKDRAFVLYRNFLNEVIDAQDMSRLPNSERIYQEVLRHGKADLEFQANELYRYGLNFRLRKEELELCEDIDFTLKHFYKELSSSMRLYLDFEQEQYEHERLVKKEQGFEKIRSLLNLLVQTETLLLSIDKEQFPYYKTIEENFRDYSQDFIGMLRAEQELWLSAYSYVEKHYQETALFGRMRELPLDEDGLPEPERLSALAKFL